MFANVSNLKTQKITSDFAKFHQRHLSTLRRTKAYTTLHNSKEYVFLNSLFGELVEVSEQIADADAVAGGFGGIGRSDALLGGSQSGALLLVLLLLESVDLLVEVEDEVRPVRDDEALFEAFEALLGVLFQLIEETRKVDHYSVT